jgi:heme/copper-type cytochrome/quinol oxidase subunit 3
MSTRRVTPSGSVLHLTDTDVSEVTRTAPAISNARLAMVVFLAFETMFFAALVGMFLVFRLSARAWPPADLPQLPIALTWVNTAVLFASAVAMARAIRALRRGDRRALERGLATAAVLGTLFLAVQGSEWVRLIGHGLTLSAGMYGATFYTLIGCHGVHVLGAVVWLVGLLIVAHRREFTRGLRVPLELCSMYWFFVVGLWAALFPLVYLL